MSDVLRDAERWRWFASAAYVITDEDGGVLLCYRLKDQEEWRGQFPSEMDTLDNGFIGSTPVVTRLFDAVSVWGRRFSEGASMSKPRVRPLQPRGPGALVAVINLTQRCEARLACARACLTAEAKRWKGRVRVREIARRTKLSAATVSLFFSGDLRVSTSTARRIARALREASGHPHRKATP